VFPKFSRSPLISRCSKYFSHLFHDLLHCFFHFKQKISASHQSLIEESDSKFGNMSGSFHSPYLNRILTFSSSISLLQSGGTWARGPRFGKASQTLIPPSQTLHIVSEETMRSIYLISNAAGCLQSPLMTQTAFLASPIDL
jgi:hypothetical protein